jgi:hypothetical protein
VALERFDDSQVAVVAPLIVDARERTVAAGTTYHAGGKVRPLAVGCPAREIREEHPRLKRRLTGPSWLAGFYRRSALDMVGLFSERVGDRLTAVDAAMSFRRLGLRTVLEPRCLVQAGVADSGRTGAFRQALEAERFFWRWAASRGWALSLAAHLVEWAAETARGFPRPVMFSRWAGRALGLLSVGSHRRHIERLDCCQRNVHSIVPMVPESPLHVRHDRSKTSLRRDAA